MLEFLREKLQTWFVERTKAANEVMYDLTPWANEKLHKIL